MISKPHWDNAARIKRTFTSLAREYKNDTTKGNVFGKKLRGRYTKKDYVIDSSNSEYPFATRIKFPELVSIYEMYVCVIKA